MNGHLEAEDMKRARTQYETHSSYPGMWTGRWTSASPSIKEEKAPAVPAAHQAHPGHQTPGPVTEIQPGQPGQQGSPGSGQSPYPATFHDTIVFSHAQPTTTSSDILYDSINISQAYPSLTSSLGKCALTNPFSQNVTETISLSTPKVFDSHACIFQKMLSTHVVSQPLILCRAPRRAVFPC